MGTINIEINELDYYILRDLCIEDMFYLSYDLDEYINHNVYYDNLEDAKEELKNDINNLETITLDEYRKKEKKKEKEKIISYPKKEYGKEWWNEKNII